MAIEEKYCDVCGHVLNLHKDNVYDAVKKVVMPLGFINNTEVWSATNCPYCNCQILLKQKYAKENKLPELDAEKKTEESNLNGFTVERLKEYADREPPKKRTMDGVMQTIYRKPRTGKTTELIRRCAENGGRIVCADAIRARCVNEMAESMNFNILYPLTFDDLQTKKYRGQGVRKVYIDNADALIKRMYPDLEIDTIVIDNLEVE